MQEPDITQPYTYTVLRMDQPDPERRTLTWGTWDKAPGNGAITTAQQAAEYAIANSRVGHSYYGPIRALLWQRGEHDHYMHAAPEDAYQYDMGAMTPPGLDAEPAGTFCACSDPDCPTPDGTYTHGGPDPATETHTVILKPDPASTLPDWLDDYLNRKTTEFLNKVFPFMEDGAWGANIPKDVMQRDVRQLVLEVMQDMSIHLSHPKEQQ